MVSNELGVFDRIARVLSHSFVHVRVRRHKGFEKVWGSKRVGQRVPDRVLASDLQPALHRILVCVQVVLGVRGNAHHPFVGNGSDGLEVILLGKQNVGRACEQWVCRRGCFQKTLDDYFLCFEGAATARSKLAKHAAVAQEGESLVFGFFELAVVRPVGVDKLKVSLGNERKNRDFVQNGDGPRALDLDVEVARFGKGKRNLGLGIKAECLEIVKVGSRKVWRDLFEVVNFSSREP